MNHDATRISEIENTSPSESDVAAFSSLIRTLKEKENIVRHTKNSIRLNLVLSAALVVSLVTNGLTTWYAVHPDRQYFATDNGVIIPLVPTSEPYHPAASIIQFGRDTLIKSFSLDFKHYRKQLQAVSYLFTNKGFAEFIAQLKASNTLTTAVEKQMVMSVVTEAGVLIKEGLSPKTGKYTWIVQYPMEIKYSGGQYDLLPKRFIATVRIERIPTNESVLGIAVAQIVTNKE